MIYLVNVSGGLASFWALKRCLDLNGTANTQAYSTLIHLTSLPFSIPSGLRSPGSIPSALSIIPVRPCARRCKPRWGKKKGGEV